MLKQFRLLSKIRFYLLLIASVILPLNNVHASTDIESVDVMVLYTDAAKDFLDSKSIKVEDEINGYIKFSNDVFKRSQVNIEYNLVYQGYAGWLSSIKKVSSDNLDVIWSDQRIHQLRSYYGADLVVVLTKSAALGGIAKGVGNSKEGQFGLRHKIIPFTRFRSF